MKKIILIGILALGSWSAWSQQQTMFTHYAFNTLAVNPAYAGSRDALTLTALGRFQWVGFDGAPVTQTLTAHTPFAKNKMGLGLSVINDKIGPIKVTSLYADLAYALPINDKWSSKLAFGLKSGVNLFSDNIAELTTTQDGDDAKQSGPNQVLPNFGLGAYYHNQKWYAGVSVPRIMSNKLNTTTTNRGGQVAKETAHFFAIAGMVMDLNEDIKFKPTTFLKVVGNAPIELDLTGMLIFQEKYEVGLMLRTGDALGLLLGYNIKPNFRIGYSFDYSLPNRTFKYNGGSHELMLRYDMNLIENKRIISPRYF